MLVFLGIRSICLFLPRKAGDRQHVRPTERVEHEDVVGPVSSDTLMPFVLYGFHLTQSLYIRWRNSDTMPLNEREKALISFLVIFVSMGMVHEIFYQRCICFIAGLLLAKTINIENHKKL